ncbi:uncharacterized protein N7515_006170 [Penicillium bovifimosum]|uniref:Uncharacterized protein n=1 Tax=Penicillium bovifimosum TaxID=126998 RepID=A0A9W9L0H5_9EURO|nr:uncharacterized protein N7515_006170 [Penicillium bovifimosum]KAJ5130131.1 hypothetical protein N7515_006170 [Penicillium bovifimosum]
MRYWEEASKLDGDDVDILYGRLQQYVASKQEDEARSIIQKALTKKLPGKDSTMVVALLATAVSNGDESHMLSVFKAVFSLVFSDPELWATFQDGMEAAIETARKAGKINELSNLLLLQGSAEYYLRRDSIEMSATATRHLRECLELIHDWDEVASRGEERLFVKQSAVARLSILYLETAMQSNGEESEIAAERLRQLHEDDHAANDARSTLASLYMSKGQKGMARGLFRADMVEAFNILVDSDVQNDGDGFTMLRTLLCHTGDYENAQRAALLYSKMRFNTTILKELLAEEEPSITADLLMKYENYQRNPKACRPEDRPWYDLQYVWAEVSRLATELEAVDSQRAIKYRKIEQIFTKHERSHWWGFSCTNCDLPWDNDNGLHACKYCYNVGLCDACWSKLQFSEAGRAFVCSGTHDWYELPPCTMEQYLYACKDIVVMKTDDGGQEAVSASKWLGMLCEEWGLSKTDWGFE